MAPSWTSCREPRGRGQLALARQRGKAPLQCMALLSEPALDQSKQPKNVPLAGSAVSLQGSPSPHPPHPTTLNTPLGRSPRQLTAAVHNCTPRQSARDGQLSAEDLHRFLQVGAGRGAPGRWCCHMPSLLGSALRWLHMLG